MSNLVDESVLTKMVYRNCPITLPNRVSYVNLVELDMLDFDIILGKDWLHSWFSSIDYSTRLVRFNFRNEPIIE